MPSIFDIIRKDGQDAVRIILTPEIAMEILEANKLNRPIDQSTVNRIVRQISLGRWKFNGDTIKVTSTFDVLDGQHRLWAVIEAKKPVETLIVFGVDREAFDTIDTLRKFRTLGDTVALEGQLRYRNPIGTALSWLLRYEREVLENYKQPANRIENADIKEAFRANPNITHSVQRSVPLRKLANTGLLGFFDYILSNQNQQLADDMLSILTDPSRTKLSHPYYLLRTYLQSDRTNKEAVKTIALMIKASNAAYENKDLTVLEWRPSGKNPEKFPTLTVQNLRKKENQNVRN